MKGYLLNFNQTVNVKGRVDYSIGKGTLTRSVGHTYHIALRRKGIRRISRDVKQDSILWVVSTNGRQKEGGPRRRFNNCHSQYPYPGRDEPGMVISVQTWDKENGNSTWCRSTKLGFIEVKHHTRVKIKK